ncbi:MAG: hypothetical protein M1837_002075 [Sclerophora amabilis]|nr:MAG: hypothetical protein M1837_002075 [Sclerophora amabilis]
MPPKRQANASLLSDPNRSRKRTNKRPSSHSTPAGNHGHVQRHGDEGQRGEPDRRKRRKVGTNLPQERAASFENRRSQKQDGGDSNELDADEGEDSEGNEWHVGHLEDDEDSEIDSDEAMGESDEERFEGFAFRGSSSTKRKGPKISKHGQGVQVDRATAGGLDLQELDEQDHTIISDEDDLGDDAVDLAAMLDDSYDAGGPKKATPAGGQYSSASSDSGDNDDASGADWDSESTFSPSDDERDNEEPSRLSTLQNLVASLESTSKARGKRPDDMIESRTPSDFGLTSSQKLTVADLLPSITDPSMKKSLKLLSDDKTSTRSRRSSGIPGKLEVPLAKRQQDRLVRAAAYDKSKQTLDRWIDTVKQNRRAEHLTFPMMTSEDGSGRASKQILPIAGSTPLNELEGAIQNILTESGLSASNGKSEEEKLQKSEELQSRKLPFDEIQARRADLRMARELLFREEMRAKRIKKIKSKSYRRVHRKQRERAEQDTRAALDAAGVGLSDEEERKHRRRAEERMGARHRESKWAKGVKASGRAAWDEDARTGVTELARRGDELTERIQGKRGKGEEHDDSPLESSDTSSVSSHSDDDDSGKQKDSLRHKLNSLDGKLGSFSGDNVGASSLSSMKFMQRAEAARAQENDAAVEQLKRELVGEESTGEEEPQSVGRRTYGTRTAETTSSMSRGLGPRNEFEEREDSDPNSPDFQNPDLNRKSEGGSQPRNSRRENRKMQRGSHRAVAEPKAARHKSTSSSQPDKDKVIPNPQKADKLSSAEAQVRPTTSKTDGSTAPSGVDAWPVVVTNHANDSSDSEVSEAALQPSSAAARDQQDLRLRAFAGDDVEQAFEQEKKRIMDEEDDQVIDHTLPGWGNWTGLGVSKREQRRNQGKVVTKVPGIAPDKRRDAKLDRVIMNEKRMKKNAKYLAPSLPHPFETRQQYERSLRLPVGPEWTTNETFQNATKPRIMIKQGIIAPLRKPMI